MGHETVKGRCVVTDNVVKIFSSAVEFETFGMNALGYIRRVKTDDINAQFELDEALPAGQDLWALFGADGNPITIADEKADVMTDADDMDLLTVQLQ